MKYSQIVEQCDVMLKLTKDEYFRETLIMIRALALNAAKGDYGFTAHNNSDSDAGQVPGVPNIQQPQAEQNTVQQQ